MRNEMLMMLYWSNTRAANECAEVAVHYIGKGEEEYAMMWATMAGTYARQALELRAIIQARADQEKEKA